jgi:putative DNA primase/helicase
MAMFDNLRKFFSDLVSRPPNLITRPDVQSSSEAPQALHAFGLHEFLSIQMPPREMLLDPILPERSLAMLYAPRGIGKSWLSLSMSLAMASGQPLLRWDAPRQRSVLYVDGEMPLVSLQERLKLISGGLGNTVPNERFRVLAADHVPFGATLNLCSEEGQRALEPLLKGIDLLILDNLSTLCTTGSESASDTWVPMQNWLLKLRRQGVSVLLVHHAGVNGRQRGTSRREDALDTVIALRRPEDYLPEEGARFEVHFEKLRNRAEGAGALPFEASIQGTGSNGQEAIHWNHRDLKPRLLNEAAQLFSEGMTVREVAVTLRISKSEAGRLRIRAFNDGLLTMDEFPEVDGAKMTVQ